MLKYSYLAGKKLVFYLCLSPVFECLLACETTGQEDV